MRKLILIFGIMFTLSACGADTGVEAPKNPKPAPDKPPGAKSYQF